MDLLKREMERKKLALALAKGKACSVGDERYVKASDLRRMQEEGEEEERLRRKRPREEKNLETVAVSHVDTSDELMTTTTATATAIETIQATAATSIPTSNANGAKKSETEIENPHSASMHKSLSPQQVSQQLRSLGLPITLFGESFIRKMQRLQAALEQQSLQSNTQTEMDEFRLGRGHGIRNPFLNRKEEEPKRASKIAGSSGVRESSETVAEKQLNEENDSSNDPHKKVYRYFKGLLNQWEDELALRPDTTKRSVAGKNETKTLKQCKDYIRPLFKQLKTRKLEEDLLHHMVKIVDCCREGEFVRAHDAYLDMAIGRSAWPIGVTMVGIHARSGRAKIEAANVAHVMNSELHRKYLTSVKRLMTFAQKNADNVDPSKKVLN